VLRSLDFSFSEDGDRTIWRIPARIRKPLTLEEVKKAAMLLAQS